MLRQMGLVISAQLETILYVTNTWFYIFGITTSLRLPSPFCKLLFVALKLLLSNVISTPPWLMESSGLETWQTLEEDVIHLTITVHSIFKMVSALTLVSPRSWKCGAFLVAIVVVNHLNTFLGSYSKCPLIIVRWPFCGSFRRSNVIGIRNWLHTVNVTFARGSGDVIWRTGKKNFNAVSHNRARP